MNNRFSDRVIDAISELGNVDPTAPLEIWIVDSESGKIRREKVGAIAQSTWRDIKELGREFDHPLVPGDVLPTVITLRSQNNDQR